MALPASPATPQRNRGFLVGLLVGLLFAAAVAIVILIATRNDDAGSAAVKGPSLSASPTSSPSTIPSPRPSHGPGLVSNTFNGAHTLSRGERMIFEGFWMDSKHFADNLCVIHTYTYKGKTHGAFESDCQDWESDGYDILIFYVGFRNTSHQAITINLRAFALQSRDGRTFAPVNVRSRAEFPTSFLPETLRLPPKATWRGYVTFDDRVEGLVPASISYIDGRQTLTQEFRGNAGTQ